MSRSKAVMHQVTVTVTKAPNEEFSFEPKSGIWSEHGHFAFNKAHYGMRDEDYHMVEFVLDDRSGEKLRFPRDPHEAMWVAKVDDPAHPICPTASTPRNYDVVEPMCVCDEGNRLVVRNDDPREEDWSFTLNLVKGTAESAAAEELVSWDPIIKNGGNGRT